MTKQHFTLRLDRATLDAVKGIAAVKGESISDVARQAIEKFVSHAGVVPVSEHRANDETPETCAVDPFADLDVETTPVSVPQPSLDDLLANADADVVALVRSRLAELATEKA